MGEMAKQGGGFVLLKPIHVYIFYMSDRPKHLQSENQTEAQGDMVMYLGFSRILVGVYVLVLLCCFSACQNY